MKFLWGLFLIFQISFAINLGDYSNAVFTIQGTGLVSGQTYGIPVTNVGDINQDGKDDFLIGASGSGNSDQNAVFLVYGGTDLSSISLNFQPGNLAISPSSAGLLVKSHADSDGFGFSVGAVGDINGDGKLDFMIGAHRKEFYRGYVYVIYGKGNEALPNPIDLKNIDLTTSGAGFVVKGEREYFYLGNSISTAGHFISTDFDDIVIGVRGIRSETGAVVIVYGATTQGDITLKTDGTLDRANGGFTIFGAAQKDYFGYSVSSAGDINKDGHNDIIIGAPTSDGLKIGKAYVIYGGKTGNLDLTSSTLPADRGFKITGSAVGDLLGCSVSGLGDVNGDGVDDFIIGASGQDSKKGAAYIIYGSTDLTRNDIDLSHALAPNKGFVVRGKAANDQLGISVKGLGDINGDGFADIMIGAQGQGGTNKGSVNVIYGKSDLSEINLASTELQPGMNGFTIEREGYFGFTVDSGDFLGNGNKDLFVGTYARAVSSTNVGYIIDMTKMCSDHCNQCIIPATCRTCLTTYFVSNSQCASCIEHCDTCLDGTTCQTCTNEYGHHEGKCVQCPVKTFLSGGSCVSCIDNCDVCEVPTVCQTCTEEYGHYEGKCVKCPTTTFLYDDGNCVSCIDNCDTCSDKTTCQTCTEEYGHYEGKCVECPVKTFLSDDGNCDACMDNCDVCENASVCQTCTEEHGHYEGKCVECPVKTFLSDDGNCVSCMDNCDICEDASACQTCTDEYGHYEGKCVKCPPTTFLSSGDCLPCIDNCDICSDRTTCQTCTDEYGHYEDKCVKCPTTTFLFDDGNCVSCIDNCDTCSDKTTCQACTEEYGHYEEKCVKCPVKTFLSDEGNCDDCIDNCDICEDASECQTCTDEFGQYEGKCVKCPLTTFLSSGDCLPCIDNCDTCSDRTTCQTCTDEYGHYEGKCVKCPVKAFLSDDGNCRACMDNCDVCEDASGCQTCTEEYGHYEGKCVKCPVKTFLSDDGNCDDCIDNCDTCSNETTCQTCTDDYGHYEGKCVECPVKTFLSDDGNCDACIDNCDVCENTSACQTCTEEYGHYEGKCVKCPVKTFLSDDGNCDACIDNCDVCKDASTCQTCTNGSGLLEGKCIGCPSKTFLSDGECLSCINNCDTCSDRTTCQTCTDEYGHYEGKCIKCPVKTFLSDNGSCDGCIDHCNVCENASTCQTCTSEYGHHEGKCVKCPVKTFLSVGNCVSCIDNCDVCQDTTTCQTCTNGSGLLEGKCIGCPSKTFLSDGECLPCIENCDNCSDRTTCQTCTDEYGHYEGKCVKCPVKTFLSDDGNCDECIFNCDKCLDGSSCQTCTEEYGHYEGKCVKCPVTTFLSDDGNCDACIDNCDICKDASQCQTCLTGYGHYKGECVKCPMGTYLSNGDCISCIDNCDTCSDSTACETCTNGYGDFKGKCVQCPSETYLSDGNCLNCVRNCATCSDSSVCQACSNGYGRSKSRQCELCPQTGKYLSSNGDCLACLPNCDQCSDSKSCQACSAGYGRFNSTCVKCPSDGLFFANGTCHSCSAGCSTCQDSLTCQVCAEGFMLSEWSTCVEKKETSAVVATSSTFEGASLIGASITAGGALPFNFGLASKMMRNIKYLDIPVSSELRQSFVSWKATSSFLSAPKSWNSNPNSESSSDPEESLSSSRRLLSESESNISHLPKVFGRYGLESAFLINYWKTLILTLVGVVLFAIFKVIEARVTQARSKKWHSFARAVHVAASNFALTQFYSNLDDVVLYLAINARSSDTSLDIVSMIIGGILLAIGGIFVAAHIWFLRRYQDLKTKQQESELEAFKLKTENISLIFKNFKDKGYATQSFLLISLIRSLVTSLIFTMLFEYPFLQVLFLLILTSAMIIFLLAVRPFKDCFDTCGQFFSEFILLLVNICMFILCVFKQVGSEPLDAIDKLSKCVIFLNVILLVGCAAFLILSILKMLFNIYKLYQEKKQTKNTSLVLSSLNKKLDGLKTSQPTTALKPNQFDQSNSEISDSHVMLNPRQYLSTYTKNFNETEQGNNMLEQRHSTSFVYDNQAEDIMDTSQDINLNLSGFIGGGVRASQQSPTKIRQEKKQALSTLKHKEVAVDLWNINDDEDMGNQIENVIPLQDSKATFKKKVSAQKVEKESSSSNSGILSHEGDEIKIFEGAKPQGELENKKQENGENSSNSGALENKEGKTQGSEAATPQQSSEKQKPENAESSLNSGLLKNHEEPTNMMDPWNIDDDVGNQLESNVTPLQDSKATFKKKKVVQKVESQQQENKEGLSNSGVLSHEPQGPILRESLQPQEQEKDENLSDPEDLKNHEEIKNIDPCNIDDEEDEEDQLESNLIPLQDFEAIFKKQQPQKQENEGAIPSPEKLNNEAYEIKISEVVTPKQNMKKNAKLEDTCNIDDEEEEQIESTMVPLQDSEATFKKKKKTQKAENIQVERMRE